MKLLSNYIVAPSLPGHFLIQLHSNHVVIHSVPKVAPAPASPPNWAKKTVAELPHPAARARLENALQVIYPYFTSVSPLLALFYPHFTSILPLQACTASLAPASALLEAAGSSGSEGAVSPNPTTVTHTTVNGQPQPQGWDCCGAWALS